MTNPNPDTPPEIQPVVAPPPNDNRRRLRDLLSMAERYRTDEQWDEIIELEIQLAPGNRISGNEHGGGQDRPAMFQNKPAGSGHAKKHRPRSNNAGGSSSNNNNRRPRQNKPPSGGNPA
jgi:hypothetical protein